MNRRTLLKRAFLALLSTIPFLGAAAPPKRRSDTVSVMSLNTDDICIAAMASERHRDAAINGILGRLSEQMNHIIKECHDQKIPIGKVEFAWRNLRHPTQNPSGNIGYVRIIAIRGIDPSEDCSQLGILNCDGGWHDYPLRNV